MPVLLDTVSESLLQFTGDSNEAVPNIVWIGMSAVFWVVTVVIGWLNPSLPGREKPRFRAIVFSVALLFELAIFLLTVFAPSYQLPGELLEPVSSCLRTLVIVLLCGGLIWGPSRQKLANNVVWSMLIVSALIFTMNYFSWPNGDVLESGFEYERSWHAKTIAVFNIGLLMCVCVCIWSEQTDLSRITTTLLLLLFIAYFTLIGFALQWLSIARGCYVLGMWMLSLTFAIELYSKISNESHDKILWKEQFEAFMDNSPFIAWVKNSSGQHLYLSQPYENQIGIPITNWHGKTDFDLWSPDVAKSHQKMDRLALESGKAVVFESNHPLPSGETRNWYVVKFPFTGGNETDEVFIGGIALDVTEKRFLEQRLLQVVDEEKRRIAHDLHDGLGQELTGMAMMAESLALNLRDKNLPEYELANKIALQLEASQQLARNLARGLRPLEIETGGLPSALSALAKRVNERYKNLECSFECDPGAEPLNSDVATHLYRITQEAVANSARHAQPDKIRILLRQMEGKLELAICDDGKGISDVNKSEAGIGMKSMRYRSHIIGGNLRVDSSEENGTMITCTLPLI